MGSARPHHFDVGGPLCDTWPPKPYNAAQSGRKRAQIVLKSAKSDPKVVPKIASRVQKIHKHKKVVVENWRAFRPLAEE